MRKFTLFIILSVICTPVFSLPIINLYQDDFRLESSVEIEYSTGATVNFTESFSGGLLNNNVTASAIDARYYIAAEDDDFSVRSVAKGLERPFGDNYYSVSAFSEVYSYSGSVTDSIQSVNSIYASAISDWLFDVEGGDVDFWAVSGDEVADGFGYLRLYDHTLSSLVLDLQGFAMPGSATLLDGHLYTLHVEAIDFSTDDAGDEVDFDFRGATIVRVSEPTSLILVGLGLIGLGLSRRRQVAK